ncbi:hypothetical protein DPMN_004446 [Dreissena polymorpha]|uniref:Sushi domain-containing protein n=1 Tax=Dreissena polymorpha TaxID=45954 RepID=A0A9D4RVM0_DREPO|nr:hypothetical protein DPMN_004446 [Dreissena polymorpha]
MFHLLQFRSTMACTTGPPAIENGYVSFSSLHNVTENTPNVWKQWTTLTYKCFRFYALVDSATQTCSAGKWGDTVPRCEYSRTTKSS